MCEELPSPPIIPFSPKLCNNLVLCHKYFTKPLNSPTVVEALYAYQTFFDHQIKRGLQHQIMLPESGGPASKVTGEFKH